MALLSRAPRSLSELSRELGLNPGQVTFYLQRLLLLGLIEKHRPITMPATSKTVRYRLGDEYLRFYFRFVEPNLRRIRRSTSYQFDRVTGDGWDVFLGLGFEQLVFRNIDPVLEKLAALDVVAEVGTYWCKPTKRRQGLQIDIVIERTDGATHLVECKWSRKVAEKDVLAALERQRRLYPNPKNHTLDSVLVAASGAARAVHQAGVRVITLRELLDP